MVECDLAKVETGVRFSSLAPFVKIVGTTDVEIKLNSKELSFFVSKKGCDDMNSKNLITDKEHRVIFNPPRIINKSEINKALSFINREMDESAEEFYQTKKDDYEL